MKQMNIPEPEPQQLQKVVSDTIEYVRTRMCESYCKYPGELQGREDLTQFQKDELLEGICEECPLSKYL